MLYALLTLCGILSFISIRSTFFPLKWAAGFAWFGAFAYWIQADLIADGSPTDMVVMLTFFFLGVIFLFMGIVTRGKAVDIEEQSVGGVTRRTARYTSYEHSPSQTAGENEYQYRLRVRKALEGNRHYKRR